MNARSVYAGIACLAPALAWPIPDIVECPRSLPAEAIRLVPPAGWQFYAESPLYLHSAAPMVTPPEGMGHLVEDAVRKRKGEETFVYRLDGPLLEGKWIQCAYGEYGQLTLSRRLHDDTQQCSVTYRKGEKAGENRITILCE